MRRRAFLSAALAAAVAPSAGGARPGDAGGVRPDGASAAGAGRPGGAGPDRTDAAKGIVAAVSFPPGCRDPSRGIDAAVSAVTGAPPGDAWRSFLAPTDRVAIKLNCLAGPRLAPSAGLVEAIVRGVASAGVPRGRIVLFDRTTQELTRAGFPSRLAEGEVRCFGTDALRGGGYGDEILEHRSIGSLFTRILTEHATVLINVGVCKDHDLSGISAGLKNLYGVIHNPNRYHAGGCDPYLADLADHPAVRPKLRLTVVDAMVAQCHGGPAYDPAHTFRPGKVLVTRDALAADAIARDWIEAERARRGLPSLAEEKRSPKWIDSAARIGIGVADRARIEVKEIDG